MADTYIIVRVNERYPDGIRTDMSTLRRALHDTMRHYGLDAGDIVLAEKPNYVQAVSAGTTAAAKEDWKTTDEIFHRNIKNAKEEAERAQGNG